MSKSNLIIGAVGSCLLVFSATLLLFLSSNGYSDGVPQGNLPIKTISLTGKKTVSFEAEIAGSQQQRAKGLMFRDALCERCAMLFIFPQPIDVTMWMRNTYIPLDMLFLDANGTIINIEHNAQPESLNYIHSKKPAKYVIEINGGVAKKLGIDETMTLDLSTL